MIPTIQQLESRYSVCEMPAPVNMTSVLAVEFDTLALTVWGQFGHGLPNKPNELVIYNVTAEQWSAINPGIPPTTERFIVNMPGGEVPVIVAAPGTLRGGLPWELTCLYQGWWSIDPPTNNIHAIPAGPEYGEVMTPPNLLLIDWLLINDTPWEFIV
jgi:hypothetical protein